MGLAVRLVEGLSPKRATFLVPVVLPKALRFDQNRRRLSGVEHQWSPLLGTLDQNKSNWDQNRSPKPTKFDTP